MQVNASPSKSAQLLPFNADPCRSMQVQPSLRNSVPFNAGPYWSMQVQATLHNSMQGYAVQRKSMPFKAGPRRSMQLKPGQRWFTQTNAISCRSTHSCTSQHKSIKVNVSPSKPTVESIKVNDCLCNSTYIYPSQQ